MTRIIVSACLAGVNCTYRGDNNLSFDLLRLIDRFILIPVCPEQLGGLATPRNPAEIKLSSDWISRKIVTDQYGNDLTSQFNKGAEEVLKISRFLRANLAILKSRSPSCGCRGVYDGSFSGIMVDGMGITAELLMKNGIEVYSEDEISFLL